jgi:hypothetical protein
MMVYFGCSCGFGALASTSNSRARSSNNIVQQYYHHGYFTRSGR